MSVIHIQSSEHLQNVLNNAGSDRLVVIDFYADWCNPCRMIGPHFEQFATTYTQTTFCKINVDSFRDIMQLYGVRAMPTFVFLLNKAEVHRIQGANVNALFEAVSRFSAQSKKENPRAANPQEKLFLAQFVKQSAKSSMYTDAINLTLAKSLIPVELLEQESMIEGKVNKFILLKKLTEWFKNEFFTWTSVPTCECGKVPSRDTCSSGVPTVEEQSHFAGSVEVYVCECGKQVRFPRYNDPAFLLQTRNGRCGEWANCFTLCAAAIGFDVRFVYDVTDHVWTEAWVPEVSRWVHVDPCENLVDAPLVYEAGWKKHLSYVIAIGTDHICDVTGKYVVDNVATRRLRQSVREPVLLNFLTKLSTRMSSNSAPERKAELQRRRLRELISMLSLKKKDTSSGYSGRTSGDEKWITERGEGGDQCTSPKQKQVILRPNDQELANKKFELSYDILNDEYVRGPDTNKGWASLVFKAKDVQLKKESDHKKTYLCRKEGKIEAEIVWSFDLTGLKVKKASLKVKGITTFENGRLILTVCADDVCLKVPPTGELEIDDPPSTILHVKALFLGGKDGCAFQHAQLFRSDWGSVDGPHMSVVFEF